MKRITASILLLSFMFTYIFPQTILGENYYSPEEQSMMLIRVNVWGNVKKAGSVLVPDGTDVIGAISFAGGPSADANSRSVTIIHADGKREKLDLTKYRGNDNDRRHNPILKPGDTVVVPANFWYGFTRGVSFVYQIAVIFYTVFQVWDMAETFLTQ